jgi:hypothetical protein
MGRKPNFPDRAGVVITLPRDLLDAIVDVAAIHRSSRAHAVELLLWRGLAARATLFEKLEAAARAGLRGE